MLSFQLRLENKWKALAADKLHVCQSQLAQS